MIVDATGLVMGRLASVAASRLLAGEEIHIVNAEKAIITGNREGIYADYGQARTRGSREGGPFFPRRPEMILKRTVRGMLPYKLKRGKDAMSRLPIYVGVPKEFKGMQFEQPEGAKMRLTSNNKYIELGDLSRRLGANF
ncbi:MAG: 50S ribosomal protein L13 [Methanotrichaceae archaeon]|nr:50S ribosomal protein L13 [Methanotrichaceae archaeon]